MNGSELTEKLLLGCHPFCRAPSAAAKVYFYNYSTGESSRAAAVMASVPDMIDPVMIQTV